MFIDSYSQNSYPSIPIPNPPAQHPLSAKTFNSEPSFNVLEFERLSLSPGAKQSTLKPKTEFKQSPQPQQQEQSISTPTPIPTQIQSFISAPIQNMTTVPNQQNMSWEPTSTLTTSTQPSTTSSLQSRLTPRTTLLPLNLLLRPLLPQPLDQSKVTSMLHTLSQCHSPDSPSLPAVDVLYYKSSKTDREFYFAFGGCHRLNALERAGREMVECKVVRVTRGMLGGYLGASLGRVLGEEED